MKNLLLKLVAVENLPESNYSLNVTTINAFYSNINTKSMQVDVFYNDISDVVYFYDINTDDQLLIINNLYKYLR
jgi:hypothetical protein